MCNESKESMEMKVRTDPPETARDRVRAVLTEAGEEGLSKSELARRVGLNQGAFRKLVQSMVDKGEVTVTTEYRDLGGKTAVHRLP